MSESYPKSPRPSTAGKYVPIPIAEIPPFRAESKTIKSDVVKNEEVENEEKRRLLGNYNLTIPPYHSLDIESDSAGLDSGKSKSSSGSGKTKRSKGGGKSPTATSHHRRSKVFRFLYRFCSMSSVQACFVAGLFVFVVTFVYAFLRLTRSFLCLGPPYLYVSTKDSSNILKYSRDGCLIHEKVLWGLTDKTIELRGMSAGTFEGEEALYVAAVAKSDNADVDYGGVFVFGTCLQYSSIRRLVSTVVTSNSNPGASHPYGLATDKNGNLYASFQHTNVVLRFDSSNRFRPMQPPDGLAPINLKKSDPSNSNWTNPSTDDATWDDEGSQDINVYRHLRDEASSSNGTRNRFIDGSVSDFGHRANGIIHVESKPKAPFFNGTFVQFGSPGLQKISKQGIRSILWTKNFTELWVANEDLNRVVIVDENGKVRNLLDMRKPVGLYSTDNLPVVFVGSKGSKNSAVHAIDKTTLQIVRSYKLLSLRHPTGIVSYEDVLIVADQSKNVVVTFNITTGRFLKVIVTSDRLQKGVEQLALSLC